MIQTDKYVRKPLYVDAVQITPANFTDVAEWCQGEIWTNDINAELIDRQSDRVNPNAQYIRVRVHNPKNLRQTKGYVGDWILYTDRGYKIYTQKAFKAVFVKAENERR